MQYLIFVYGKKADPVMHVAPLRPKVADYLRRAVETLRPLSRDEYVHGPAAILRTAAKFIYVLHGDSVLWCVEWAPGILMLRFSPDGEMSWTAIRSPVPNFGGRDASAADLEAFDEDAENPQYRLIFDAWDAQYDEQKRASQMFTPVRPKVTDIFKAAVSRVNKIELPAEYNDPAQRSEFTDRCINNLKAWCGEGIRLQ